MKNTILNATEVLNGYDLVVSLYPHIPSMSHWRAWESAAYKRYQLSGRVLDLGCGDGQYFKLIWPAVEQVIGLDISPEVVALGRASGVYEKVYLSAAHQVPEADASFDCVFANCSLEHMDELDKVIGEISRCLKPGGLLLCSVVTNRFVDWATLPNLLDLSGFKDQAAIFRNDFLDYHHLVNPLTVQEWESRFDLAGLVLQEHIPILPKWNSGLFLLVENLWHVKKENGGEMGDEIYSLLSQNVKFPAGFRQVLSGFLNMETDWLDCSGAVFKVTKPK